MNAECGMVNFDTSSRPPIEAEREEVNLGIGYCQKNVYTFLTIDF